MQCHREALLVGDNEYASFAGSFYCAQSIVCGANLPMMEKECGLLALKLVSNQSLAYFGYNTSTSHTL